LRHLLGRHDRTHGALSDQCHVPRLLIEICRSCPGTTAPGKPSSDGPVACAWQSAGIDARNRTSSWQDGATVNPNSWHSTSNNAWPAGTAYMMIVSMDFLFCPLHRDGHGKTGMTSCKCWPSSAGGHPPLPRRSRQRHPMHALALRSSSGPAAAYRGRSHDTAQHGNRRYA